ncbi:beta-1,3-glucan-binding protein 1 [Anabrus simplex]|uniref:beta-1,3-glucan-binding protein 1 n=1 Tax=Anabrus simplex TaxID=316456 RepID=UPI0035A2F636
MWCAVVVLVGAVVSVVAQSPYYEVPEALIQPLKPKGLRISIPDEPGVELFAIHVNVNKPMGNREAGQINQEIRKAKNGRWVVEDPRVRLKRGDKLNYWLYVQADGLGYPKDDLTYTVTEFYDPAAPIEQHEPQVTERVQSCLPTVTTVNGGPSCEGKLVFEDLFDNFNSTTWQRVVQFGTQPDFEFVVYTDDQKNSYVADGKLHIRPTLLADDGKNIESDFYTLNGCTSTQRDDCSKTGQGWNILPPVKSAQLRTRQSFSFRYGRVEVQAKLPSGDWIFPEIWLEPKNNKYGTNLFESGLIQMALVRANRNLMKDKKDLGARHLEVACVISSGKTVHSETFSMDSNAFWSDNFHIYSVTWTPDDITFTVDGRDIGRVTPPAGGFSKLSQFSRFQNIPWSQGSKMAPFDEEFYITIGLGVGGFRVFPDDSVSNNRAKPWKDSTTKALVNFWQNKDNWYPSWSGDGSTLQVQHVKVWAL